MSRLDGDLLNLLQQELEGSSHKDGKRARNTKRASGGRRAKLSYEKQVHMLEQELNAKLQLARELENQKRALTENLQMLELHCKATGHYVQLMQEGEQQAKATAWLQKHTNAARNAQGASQPPGTMQTKREPQEAAAAAAAAAQQQPDLGNEECAMEGMDWRQLLDGLADAPVEQDLLSQTRGDDGADTPTGAAQASKGPEAGDKGCAAKKAAAQPPPQPPQQQWTCLSLSDVPLSDRPNEVWLAAMRRATVDDFANLIKEFVTVAGPLVLQAEAHGGLTPALNHLCLHVTRYMEFSNVLAIARSRTLYEAIELDLETRTPRKPPHGFWANVACVMRCTPEQVQQVQAAMRSYTTSLSSISEERMLLSKELAGTIQASEAAARAVGQGSRGAVEQAEAANELQQVLAKRLAGNVQRQVLCHSMLRVYHTRKVFTPVQIAKAIICSWPFVANVPSIWAAIIEASATSPSNSLSECRSHEAPQQQQQQRHLAGVEPAVPVPFPSSTNPAGFPEAVESCTAASAAPSLGLGQWGGGTAQPQASQAISHSGVGQCKGEGSMHGERHMRGLSRSESGAPFALQPQFQPQPHALLQAGEGSLRGGQHFGGALVGQGSMFMGQQQQQQQQHLLAFQGANTQGLVGGGGGAQEAGMQGCGGVTPMDEPNGGSLSRVGSAQGGLHTWGGAGMGAGVRSSGGRERSARGGQQFFIGSPSGAAAAGMQLARDPQGERSAHGGQQFFAPLGNGHLPATAAAGVQPQQLMGSRGGSTHGAQQFFASPAIASGAIPGVQSTAGHSRSGSAHGGTHFFSAPAPAQQQHQHQHQPPPQQQQLFGSPPGNMFLQGRGNFL